MYLPKLHRVYDKQNVHARTEKKADYIERDKLRINLLLE